MNLGITFKDKSVINPIRYFCKTKNNYFDKKALRVTENKIPVSYSNRTFLKNSLHNLFFVIIDQLIAITDCKSNIRGL